MSDDRQSVAVLVIRELLTETRCKLADVEPMQSHTQRQMYGALLIRETALMDALIAVQKAEEKERGDERSN